MRKKKKRKRLVIHVRQEDMVFSVLGWVPGAMLAQLPLRVKCLKLSVVSIKLWVKEKT